VHVSPDAPRRVEGRIAVLAGAGLGIDVDEKTLGMPVVTVRG
jgi:hypothetical protein